jgi:hypothetical protein
MSDPRDTPMLGVPWCPRCAPDLDPSTIVLEIDWCDRHRPTIHGADDALVTVGNTLTGGQEAGGDSNRSFCELIHRCLRELSLRDASSTAVTVDDPGRS